MILAPFLVWATANTGVWASDVVNPGSASGRNLALKPHLGFSTWNAFKTVINESAIRETADLLVSLGLAELGYKYVNIDDQWQRNASREITLGKLQWNTTRFPSGIPALAEYLHAKGLKIGIYSDTGFTTCSGTLPGSYGYEEVDAKTFAEWGIDYLKYDNCAGGHGILRPPRERFSAMQNALIKSGRDIVFSICEWGFQFPWLWAPDVGHSYRMSGDIWANYTTDKPGCRGKTAYSLTTGDGGCSVQTILRKMREIAPFQKPGSWADMDILEVGNLGNGNFDQEVTHFSYWAALKSPLLIGTPLTTISKRSLEVLKNQEIIALNQDNLGIAPWYLPKISVEGQSQYWAGPLEQGWVILLTNDLADKPQDLSIRWSDVAELPQRKSWRVRDLWAHKDLGSFEVGVSFKNVPPHGTKVIRLT